MTKFMTVLHQIPSKIKPPLFTSCFNRASNRGNFDYWGGRKILTALLSQWSDDMGIETIKVFQISQLGGTDQKSCSF